jgi:hypothetical protein
MVDFGRQSRDSYSQHLSHVLRTIGGWSREFRRGAAPFGFQGCGCPTFVFCTWVLGWGLNGGLRGLPFRVRVLRPLFYFRTSRSVRHDSRTNFSPLPPKSQHQPKHRHHHRCPPKPFLNANTCFGSTPPTSVDAPRCPPTMELGYSGCAAQNANSIICCRPPSV